MLPAAGLVVHQMPGQPDDVDEKALGEPVLAQDRLRHPWPCSVRVIVLPERST